MSIDLRTTPTGIAWMSAEQLGRAYRRRELSPVEVTRATLARIERLNPTLPAFHPRAGRIPPIDGEARR